MKTLIFSTLLLAMAVYLPANSTNIKANQVISRNHTTEDKAFRAFGTEPFWSVDVRPSGVIYSSLAREEKQNFPYVKPLTADGRTPDTVQVYRLGNEKTSMLIIREFDSCSDGMSDKLHPYSALFVQGDMVLEGCARKLDK
ncbi:COG3650 family protein [Umezakia sp. BLCC-F208]